ncbi:Spy/CpxP family protein refolding chaperone [Hyphomicrobium sp.]|uniref:Spy/CpxP family protein refolding chaperone n=1 Tax=Hyphomicrobium sp. TaxID=82 RepID=UPI002D775F03|nr:Spy/CpxP family protein refolding chaperone [Hyphomicrobium sp.]HET6388107.1 Spy/CpxP family protein refolding chaperone [Hyphomicrobium sp.]
MSRLLASGFTALLIAVPSLAIAQTAQPMQGQPMQGQSTQDMQGMQPSQGMQRQPAMQRGMNRPGDDITNNRIDIVKTALQLRPDQMQYWPAIEEAIRARAEGRRQRIGNMVSRMQEGQFDQNFVQVLQNRADNLIARGTEMKKLADAWQPLYSTLDDAQKRRVRVLIALVLQRMREGMEDRREMMMDDEGDGAMMGAGTGESGIGR